MFLINFLCIILLCSNSIKANLLNIINTEVLMNYAEKHLSEDFNFTELCKNNGYDVQTHELITNDGQIFTLFNIPGKDLKKDPLLFIHGLCDSADGWIIRENNSLGFALSDFGYDLWFTNLRGSKYSRRHKTLDPDVDRNYWNFGYDQMAIYDLPAMIDYILESKKQNHIKLIGVSIGSSIPLILLSEKPEYNDKVSLLIGLSPTVYMKNVHSTIKNIAANIGLIGSILFGNSNEIYAKDSKFTNILKIVCSDPELIRETCAPLFYGTMVTHPEHISYDFFPKLFAHYPTSCSKNIVFHTAQMINLGLFAKYSYGSLRNLKEYNTVQAPSYDLSKVTTEVVLFAAKTDGIAPLKDVELLRDRLPRAELEIIDSETLRHFDFIWGNNILKYLLPKLLKYL